jgi:hypothetical protein
MGWTVPEYSRPMVDAAGRDLVNMWSRPLADPAEVDRFMEAWGILNNWRSAHSFPLNTFQTTLRTKARKVFPNVIVAQRIKRAVTIVHKLERLPRLSLSKLQDVGGCRAIVGSSSHVHKIRKAYLDSQLRHELKHEKDYIAEPKESGYRGIHLVYRYISDRSEDYNGLQIELQLRSRYQHAWATAVETAGTFLERSLKSSRHPQRQRRTINWPRHAVTSRKAVNQRPDLSSASRTRRGPAFSHVRQPPAPNSQRERHHAISVSKPRDRLQRHVAPRWCRSCSDSTAG